MHDSREYLSEIIRQKFEKLLAIDTNSLRKISIPNLFVFQNIFRNQFLKGLRYDDKFSISF